MIETGKIDLRPKVFYGVDGRLNKVETYCVVNGWTIAISNYVRNKDGKFYEDHFDECHGIYSKNKPCSDDRIASLKVIEELSLLDLLNATNKEEVEKLTQKVKLWVRHS